MGLLGEKNHAVGSYVYDYLIAEAERFDRLRDKDKDLYFRNPNTGEFVKVALAYHKEVEDLSNKLFHRRKTRFFVTFNETMDLEDCMTKMELRVVRYLARRMGYDNEISGIGYNEMQGDLGSQFRYVKGAIDGLISRNVLKFKVVKNRRVYMLNPSFYYKGNMLGIFRAVKKFSAF